jgi:hypothetical protein
MQITKEAKYLEKLKCHYTQLQNEVEDMLQKIRNKNKSFDEDISLLCGESICEYERCITHLESVLQRLHAYYDVRYEDLYRVLPLQKSSSPHAYFIRYQYAQNTSNNQNNTLIPYLGLTIKKCDCIDQPNIDPSDAYDRLWTFGDQVCLRNTEIPNSLSVFLECSNDIARDTRRGAGNILIIASQLFDVVKPMFTNIIKVMNCKHPSNRFKRWSAMRFCIIEDTCMKSKSALLAYVGTKENDCGATLVSCGDKMYFAYDGDTNKYFRRIKYE